jgi:ribosome-binding factor A
MPKKRGRWSSGGGASSPSRFPRTARVNEVLREIIATELERIVDDDPRLELVTITGIDVERDLHSAKVFFSSLATTASTEEVIDALNQHRIRFQKVVAKSVTFKRTPLLEFHPDLGITEGQKVESILRDLRTNDPESD